MLSSTASTISNINSDTSNPAAIIRTFLSEVYDVEHQIGDLIQQKAYGTGSSSRREINNSSIIYWIHGNLCREIFYAYSAGKQKLSRRLHSAFELRIHHQERHSFLQSLMPVLSILTQKMRHGQAFIETCRVVKTSDDMDLELEWLTRAVKFSLSPEAAEIHLHDFLLCFCSVIDAIKAAEENFATTQRNSSVVARPAHALSSRRSSTQSVIRFEEFWKDVEKQSSYVLMEGKLLDEARDADLAEMQIKTEQILQRLDQNGSSNGDLGYKFCVANHLKWRLQAQINSSQIEKEDPTGMIESDVVGVYADFADLEFIDRTEGSSSDTEFRKVQWRPCGSQVFNFKEYSRKDHFLKEISENFRLNHPNVVRAICSFKQELDGDKVTYGVLMELSDMNLTQYLESNPSLGLAEKVSIMLQIAMAMEYIQSQKIDIFSLQPENVLVKFVETGNGTPSFQIKVSAGFHSSTEAERYDSDVLCFDKICRKILRGSSDQLQKRSSFKVVGKDLPSDCPPYLKRCIATWSNSGNQYDSSSRTGEQFTEICRTLRHLYGVLIRQNSMNIQSSSEQNLLRFNDYEAFMKTREVTRNVMQRAMADMSSDHNFNLCRFSRVHTIPYEIHVVSVVLQWGMDIPHRSRSSSFKNFIDFLTSPTPAVMGTAGVFDKSSYTV